MGGKYTRGDLCLSLTHGIEAPPGRRQPQHPRSRAGAAIGCESAT